MSNTTQTVTASSVPVINLVRPQALAAHAAGTTRHSIDPMGRSRTPVAFLVLAIALAALIGVASELPIEEHAVGHGRVLDDGRTITLSLPIASQAKLQPGMPAQIDIGGRSLDGHVVAVSRPRTEDGEAVAVASARLDVGAGELPGGDTGRAQVQLSRRPLWQLISPTQLFRGVRRG